MTGRPTDPGELIKEINHKLEAGNLKEVAARCSTLVTCIYRQGALIDIKKAEHLLLELRSHRQFQLIQSIADALLQTGTASLKIQRLYVQSLIDQGLMTAALAVLAQLQQESGSQDHKEALAEYREARGLEGRLYKQLYLRSGQERFIHKAIEAYRDIYNRDPEQSLWQGINLVALLMRAERDVSKPLMLPMRKQSRR